MFTSKIIKNIELIYLSCNYSTTLKQSSFYVLKVKNKLY